MAIQSPGFGMPQPEVLYKHLYSLNIPGDVLELGAAYGRSSSVLGFACKFNTEIRKIHSVDIDYKDEWTKNIYKLGLKEHFISHKMYFAEFYRYAHRRNMKFAFIFIDGLHDFLSVSFDIFNATRLLLPGGIIACHDYGLRRYPGVTLAVKIFLFRTNKFRILSDREAGSLLIVQSKQNDNSRFVFNDEIYGYRCFISGLIRSIIKRKKND
jgi:hypothetical protein